MYFADESSKKVISVVFRIDSTLCGRLSFLFLVWILPRPNSIASVQHPRQAHRHFRDAQQSDMFPEHIVQQHIVISTMTMMITVELTIAVMVLCETSPRGSMSVRENFGSSLILLRVLRLSCRFSGFYVLELVYPLYNSVFPLAP